MAQLRVFWGETHNNTHQVAAMTVPYDEMVRRAATHVDFYAAAYYTACAEAFKAGGHLSESSERHPIILEGWKSQGRLDREWAEVQEVIRAANAPGRFVTFPGYEWQGDGSGGDHNVFAREEGLPIFRVDTLAELYACLRGRDAIAIPHHTAYRPGVRGRDWAVYDETLSPFCEIFSVHGCSETDEEWVGMRHNSHMGPGYGAGTWQAALDRGYRLGAIGSTDSWDAMPAHYGRGLMGCWAESLTRDDLWRAFKARHVYGVTGDRIVVDFRLNDAMMGDIVAVDGPRRIRVRAVGLDAIDRIELLRDGRVIATHCHQGAWSQPPPGHAARWRVRIEAGWGPRPNELPVREHAWQGEIQAVGGRVLDSFPCWISPGQQRPALKGDAASFAMRSSTANVGEPWQNANVFEFEADPAALLRVRMNGLEEARPVAEFAAASRELWFKDECIRMLADEAGLAPLSPERMDIYHHCAHKVKIHRPIPAAGYTAELAFDDDEPLAGETHYRVRVEQRNGQRAWSSPIWAAGKGL